MQELARTLESLSTGTESLNADAPEEVGILDEAAGKWALYCLKIFRGALLRRGLEISRSIAEFTIELQGPGKDFRKKNADD